MDPIYIRLPRQMERCPWTGLSRGAINALVLPTKDNKWKPPVESRVLRRCKGQKSGIRLIVLKSLLAYIERNPQEIGDPRK
jgi:hypothetical protein